MAKKKKNFLFCRCKTSDSKATKDTAKIVNGEFLFDGFDCNCEVVAHRRKDGIPTAKIKKLSGIGDLTVSAKKVF